MIRVALYILVVGAIAAGTAWLADRPGEIVLTWQGWHVETTVMVAVIAVVAIVVALMILWSLLRLIIGGPGAITGYFRSRRQSRGFKAISRGMVAVGAGDVRLARHQAGEARKLMPAEPLALLLEAQAAQLGGDRAAARKVFETMIERPETELLGLRGLFIEAQRDGDTETARACVERAAERGPGIAWAAGGLFDIQTREGDWAAALATLERNATHRLIDKKAARRARAVLLTAQAQEREDADPEAALALALEAHKLAPELVPAAVIAARQSSATGNTRQATRIVEKTWRLSQHPDLAEVYAHARAGDSARDRLKRARALLAKMPNNVEGRLGVAVAAIEARDWTAAREALEPLARSQPSQRICLLMAEIGEGETGDAGLVREWLSRAVRAPRDPVWVADGWVSEHWAPVSPVTGRLDAFEWKVPLEALGGAGPDATADPGLPGPVAGTLIAAGVKPVESKPEAAPAEEPAAPVVIEDLPPSRPSAARPPAPRPAAPRPAAAKTGTTTATGAAKTATAPASEAPVGQTATSETAPGESPIAKTLAGESPAGESPGSDTAADTTPTNEPAVVVAEAPASASEPPAAAGSAAGIRGQKDAPVPDAPEPSPAPEKASGSTPEPTTESTSASTSDPASESAPERIGAQPSGSDTARKAAPGATAGATVLDRPERARATPAARTVTAGPREMAAADALPPVPAEAVVDVETGDAERSRPAGYPDRLPDDPGPLPADDEDRPKRRFGLF